MIEYVTLGILTVIILCQIITIRTERIENARMQLELMNRIQAPDTAVWKSLTSEVPTEKGMPDPPDNLSPALSSEAEEGEMHLVGKIVQGDFGKDNKNES